MGVTKRTQKSKARLADYRKSIKHATDLQKKLSMYGYSNRSKRRTFAEKLVLTEEDIKSKKTVFKKWAETVAQNIEMGNILNETYQNMLADYNMQYEQKKNSDCLASLEVWYGDKDVAMKVHRNNIHLKRILVDKKFRY